MHCKKMLCKVFGKKIGEIWFTSYPVYTVTAREAEKHFFHAFFGNSLIGQQFFLLAQLVN